MTILISYDGSDNAESAISAAARLVARENASAVVLAVWEPLVVQALRAEKFGAPLLAVPNDAAGEDELSARAARQLAEHGVSVAAEAGFDARARWVADGRSIATTIIEEADELDAGPDRDGVPRTDRDLGVPRQRLEPRAPARPPPRSGGPRRIRGPVRRRRHRGRGLHAGRRLSGSDRRSSSTPCTWATGVEILATGWVSGELLGEPSPELRAKMAGSGVSLFTPYKSM